MNWLRRLHDWLSEPFGEHLQTLSEADCEANARPVERVIEPLPIDRPRLGIDE